MREELAEPVDVELDRFWDAVRPEGAPTQRPEAWAFGGTVPLANELLALVLAGTKTSTAGALWDYEADGDPIPEAGQLNILLDAAGEPRALIRISSVAVVPFADVDAEHAWLEGEGDRSLADWREGHERFFTEFAAHDRGFSTDMPIVLERFELLHPAAPHL